MRRLALAVVAVVLIGWLVCALISPESEIARPAERQDSSKDGPESTARPPARAMPDAVKSATRRGTESEPSASAVETVAVRVVERDTGFPVPSATVLWFAWGDLDQAPRDLAPGDASTMDAFLAATGHPVRTDLRGRAAIPAVGRAPLLVASAGELYGRVLLGANAVPPFTVPVGQPRKVLVQVVDEAGHPLIGESVALFDTLIWERSDRTVASSAQDNGVVATAVSQGPEGIATLRPAPAVQAALEADDPNALLGVRLNAPGAPASTYFPASAFPSKPVRVVVPATGGLSFTFKDDAGSSYEFSRVISPGR